MQAYAYSLTTQGEGSSSRRKLYLYSNHQLSFKTLPFLTVLLVQAHKKGKYNKKKDRLINLLLKLVYSMREQSTKSRNILGQTVVPYKGSVLHGPLEQNHSCKQRGKGMSRGQVTSGGMVRSHPLTSVLFSFLV